MGEKAPGRNGGFFEIPRLHFAPLGVMGDFDLYFYHSHIEDAEL